MAKSSQTKDDALDALDFIVNVLKEHERDLDKLIKELAKVSEQIGDTGSLSSKVGKIEEKINGLQKEVTNLIGYLTPVSKEHFSSTPAAKEQITLPQLHEAAMSQVIPSGPLVTLRCIHWGDFQALAVHAQTLSFRYKEDDKVFQVYALKGNQVVTYSGPLEFSMLVKAALSKQLDVSERSIFEGVLAIG